MLLSFLAAPGTAPAQDLRFLHQQAWSVEEGLPQSSVHAALQSKDGYIWVATEAGVARFDGVSFRILGKETTSAFTSGDVCCLAQDGDGSLWFGTSDGVVRLSGGRWQHLGEAEGLPGVTVLQMATGGDGALIVLTTKGVVRWTGERFEPVAGDPVDVAALGHGADGAILLLERNGLARLRAAQMKMLTHETLPSGHWKGVEEGPGGALWLRSSETVLLRKAGALHEWRAGRELPGSRVESLRVDRSGTAWVGCNGGLGVLQPDSPRATTIPALAGDAVLTTMEDAEGSHWVGTDAAGLHLLRALPFRSVPPLTNRAITSVLQATDGAVWAGTREDGLRRLQGDRVAEPVRGGGLTSPVILSLARGQHGGVWAGTPDGLNRLAPDGRVRRYVAADGLPDEDARSLAGDEDGSVWVGTRRGLAHVAGDRVHTLTRADGLPSDLVGTLLQVRSGPAAGLWISTSGGLSRLNAAGALQTFSADEGLGGGIVTGMALDRSGTLWVATDDGVVGRLGSNGRFQSTEVFAPEERIAGIAVDGRDGLWVRTARGIWKVALPALARCLAAESRCDAEKTRYGVADGLPSEELVPGGSPAVWRGEGGELWVATRRGLAVGDPDHMMLNRVPPPVVLERFAVDDRTLPLDGETIALPYGHDRFTMEYAGLSFVAPGKVRYRFQLEGFDHDWTEAGGRRTATYTNLPPGQYTFRVQASNNDGVWNRDGARVAFRVVPPWYRRWWFVLVCVAAAAALIYALYWLRLRRVQREFAAVLGERNRIAREIHDTLAQDFVGVSLQLEIATQMLSRGNPDAATAQLDRARQLVRDGIADARESIWELRANTAQDSLPTRLTRLTNRYATPAMTVRASVTGAYRALAAGTENEVLRIAQEALTNVEKHAGATAADVLLEYGGEGLCLTISDNGHGFAVGAVPQGHYGLRGMQERAAGLGGRLLVQARSEGGTTVRLEAPLGAAER